MDASGAQSRPAQPGPHHQGSLIRAEQVLKLPHLNDNQKAQHEMVIRRLWDTINSRPAGSEEHTSAYRKLSGISTNLMQQMKLHQQKQRQQMAAQQASQMGTARPSQGTATAVSFNQLSPEIQRRVNEARFCYPPAMIQGTQAAEEWLKEAKARYGHALQRSEIARAKKTEMQRQAHNREQSGNPLTQQEREVYNNKVGQCDKAIQESESFMTKFKEQQTSFRAQTQARFSNQAPGPGVEVAEGIVAPAPAGAGPTAHTIGSAVSAARSQAAAAAQSPQQTQAALATSSTPTQTSAPGMQPSPYHPQAPHADGANGLHRPLPHPGQSSAHPSSASHAHPPNYLNHTKKDDRHPITKQIQVQSPRPVDMPPSRPTLTGGPNVGMPGQMAMPALSSYPGYVLEASENGKVLSKKKLNELVRQVCGPGQEEQLTPEVEEVFHLPPSHDHILQC